MHSSVLFLLLLSGVFPLLGPEKEDSSKYLKTKSVVSMKDDFEGRGVLEPEGGVKGCVDTPRPLQLVIPKRTGSQGSWACLAT